MVNQSLKKPHIPLIPASFRTLKKCQSEVQAHDPMMAEATTIMAALSTLSPPQLSDLTLSIFSDINRHHYRLLSLLSSPALFSLTLHHLHSLSLQHKALLIARHLLSALRRLTLHLHPKPPPPPPLPSITIKQRDLDAVLLLLLLCEIRQHNPEALETSPTKWRAAASKLWSGAMLTLSGIGFYNGSVLIPYVEMVTRCWKFVGEMGHCGGDGDGKVAASPAAVVALPSVGVRGRGVECVICKEEMREGRDVCELPCEHLFHWMCILPWLRKSNTCPCCRFPLPTDDVFGEIQRLWELLVKIGSRRSVGECT
ncbi:hypothetical protein I3843_09G181100 [Carya illinoinensis]|nr:hypothetical protein I3843_09G181100 [Carya illinoinensis]